MPNANQLRSIIPYSRDASNHTEFLIRIEQAGVDQGVLTRTEFAQVGSEAAQEYTSEYVTKKEGERFVTYALRFKGTKWQSAWQYSVTTAGNGLAHLIQCINLKDQTIDLSTIAEASFFEGKAKTVRVLPVYGFYSANKLAGIGEQSGFWGSESNPSNSLLGMHIYYYPVVRTLNGYTSKIVAYSAAGAQKIKGIQIRPFYKQLP